MGKIQLEKLNNTRDLGGINVAGGSIIPGMLIRSGQLGIAGEGDLRWISDNIDVVMDFRSSLECAEVPDPDIEGVEYIHIPIVDDLAAGVSRDSKSDEEAVRMLIKDPGIAMKYMCGMYEHFIVSETARNGYEAFVRKLFEDKEKTILWHCTVGKDRAGFATAIVLEMLGTDREAIIADYLETNENIKQNIESLKELYFGRSGAIDGNDGSADSGAGIALGYLFGANREFLEAAYAKAEELYGDFRGYIREGLHIADDEIEAWKASILSK